MQETEPDSEAGGPGQARRACRSLVEGAVGPTRASVVGPLGREAGYSESRSGLTRTLSGPSGSSRYHPVNLFLGNPSFQGSARHSACQPVNGRRHLLKSAEDTYWNGFDMQPSSVRSDTPELPVPKCGGIFRQASLRRVNQNTIEVIWAYSRMHHIFIPVFKPAAVVENSKSGEVGKYLQIKFCQIKRVYFYAFSFGSHCHIALKYRYIHDSMMHSVQEIGELLIFFHRGMNCSSCLVLLTNSGSLLTVYRAWFLPTECYKYIRDSNINRIHQGGQNSFSSLSYFLPRCNDLVTSRTIQSWNSPIHSVSNQNLMSHEFPHTIDHST